MWLAKSQLISFRSKRNTACWLTTWTTELKSRQSLNVMQLYFRLLLPDRKDFFWLWLQFLWFQAYKDLRDRDMIEKYRINLKSKTPEDYLASEILNDKVKVVTIFFYIWCSHVNIFRPSSGRTKLFRGHFNLIWNFHNFTK